MPTLSTDTLAHLVPDPAAVHRRLGELSRERRLLRRLLSLSLAAKAEADARWRARPAPAELEAADAAS